VSSFLSYFFSSWGLLFLSFLDSSVIFFAPLANDVVVVILSARHRHSCWSYPLIATAGALAGSAMTYWIGEKVGEKGLDWFGSKGRLRWLKGHARKRGAVTLALSALIPPPFPQTLLVLTCGALHIEKRRFFITLTLARLLRYGVLSVLAVLFGRHILSWFHSDIVKGVVIAFIVVAVAGTVYSFVSLWRGSGPGSKRPAEAQPAPC